VRTAARSCSRSRTGYRESEDSWATVFRDLRDRGMNEPKLVTGDGALGAWAAPRNVFPHAGEQRCWVHKTANVLDCLPKRLQPRAKMLLYEMAEAPSRADARKVLERFREEFDAESTPRPSPSSTRTGRRLPRSTTSRRALAASADYEPDRKQFRDREAPHKVTKAALAMACAGAGSTATSSSQTYSKT
jgi:hypothetical protein